MLPVAKVNLCSSPPAWFHSLFPRGCIFLPCLLNLACFAGHCFLKYLPPWIVLAWPLTSSTYLPKAICSAFRCASTCFLLMFSWAALQHLSLFPSHMTLIMYLELKACLIRLVSNRCVLLLGNGVKVQGLALQINGTFSQSGPDRPRSLLS